ncbi:tyrosine-type recombinase/integrase, partial [Lentilactobacillus buchneri]|uniref:tyrosine-type recombinase/integrase n=1 Tax=Lentilactobacillus buchneri TaxID=1581 RepID=UPI001560F9E5
KRITFHGLRHTHASFLISKGVTDQYVARRLGHENTVVTRTTYAHLFKDKQTEEEDKTVELLNQVDNK